jgi:iron complex outermembrane recepter protein
MLKTLAVLLTAAPMWPLTAHAQHQHSSHTIDEVIVSASQNKTRAETALPINVLSGEELRQQATATLGETISKTIGVHSTSFGAGVGQPVIRGLSGNRVNVLQNNLSTLDASGASQDHTSSVEALLAERIEIIRGPATLLYGNGAIGGIVNVIDGRIPEVLPSELKGAVEVRFGSVNEGSAIVGKLDGSAGQFAWHLDGLYRDTDDYDIPGWAIDTAAVEALAHHEEEEHEAEEHTEEAQENTHGFVPNASTQASNITAGASWVGEKGFFGLAISQLKNEYGLPPGAHGHHHEEEAGAEVEEEHAEFVRLKLEQTRVDVSGGWALEGILEQLDWQLTSNRYEHKELEGSAVGTVFKNDGVEGRFTLNHGPLNPGYKALSGVVGLQVSDRDFSALGEEAFIPQSVIRSAGIFILESFEHGAITYEMGARIDRQTIDTRGRCDSGATTRSASAAAIWDYREDTNLSLSLSRSERAPTVEELYSNADTGTCATEVDPEAWIVHAATARFELGNAGLGTETGNNLELGWHKHLGDVRAELNLFYNRFDDFIYLADAGEFEETIVSRYLQADATFKGIEGQVLFPILRGDRHLDLTVFADLVRAKLANGDNLPRIPPARLGFELAYGLGNWSAHLRTTAVGDQEDVAEEELATDGYLRVDAYLDYHLPITGQELLVFLKGNNLTNEVIRDHTSFLKHYAPAPGRAIEMGLRYRF